jgi:lysophospholipase L1-like esterase
MRLLVVPIACILVLTACQRAQQRPLTYVAIGASDAVGVGARDPETEGWVPRLGSHLGSNARVINLGVSGSTLEQALDEQLGPAIDAQPDIVTVWLAVNDFSARVPLESYASDLDRMLEALQRTNAHVLVANMPVLPGRVEQVDAWNDVINSTVQRHGATLVDVHAHWQEAAQHPEYLSQDGFHPSSEGYARLADLFAEALDGPR